MFGIGETELVIILLFAFMLFGPDKLPGMGRTIGRALRQFREAQEGFTKVVQTEIVDPINKAADDPEALIRRRKAIEEDADIESGAEAQSPDKATSSESQALAPEKRESFAERRARLKAEAQAASQDEVTQTHGLAPSTSNEQPVSEGAHTDTTADTSSSDVTSAADRPETAPHSAQAAPATQETATHSAAPTSAAALYGLTAAVPAASDEDTNDETEMGKEARVD